MKPSITILLLLSLTSCDIMKKSTKTKTDIVATEEIQTKTTRKGDTVTFIIPKITYKDTVITTVSTQGTILKTYFDKSGQVVKSDCISSEIELLRLEMRTIVDQSKTKDKQKTEQYGVGLIPWLFGVIAFLGLSVIIALFMYFRGNTR
jgi:hypothetical protein